MVVIDLLAKAHRFIGRADKQAAFGRGELPSEAAGDRATGDQSREQHDQQSDRLPGAEHSAQHDGAEHQRDEGDERGQLNELGKLVERGLPNPRLVTVVETKNLRQGRGKGDEEHALDSEVRGLPEPCSGNHPDRAGQGIGE